MKSFEMRYGLGGGFGGIDDNEWVPCFSLKLEEAIEEAYEAAVEEYHSYDGLHGLDTYDSIKEKNPDWDDDEIYQELNEIIENWIDYEVREVIEDKS